MTPALRKYHRIVWFALAIILPVFYVTAIIAIPKQIVDTKVNANVPGPLSIVLRTKTANTVDVALRSDAAGTEFQLEVIVRKALTNPESLLYASFGSSTNSGQRVLIGKLSSRGTYRFSPGKPESMEVINLEIFDPITNVVIENISL